ncbi:MAG: type II toxin-antitoxin system RelE/ParE family toxin [Gammaproteobacteria bacterium]
MRVEFSEAARHDLIEIITYIAQENPVAAYEVDAEIHRQIGMLVSQPDIGRPGRISGMKELVIVGLPYISPYQVKSDTVEILRVLHTSRQWP